MINKCVLCNSNNIYEKCNLICIINNSYIIYNNKHYKVINSVFIRKDFNYDSLNGYSYGYTLLDLHKNMKIYLEINTRNNNIIEKYKNS